MMDDSLTPIYLFLVLYMLKSFALLKKNWFVCFLIIEQGNLFIYSWCKSFIVVFWKYFLLICRLFFIFLTLPFEEQKIIIFMKSSLSSFYGSSFFLLYLMNRPNPRSPWFSRMFSCTSFTVLSFHIFLLN